VHSHPDLDQVQAARPRRARELVLSLDHRLDRIPRVLEAREERIPLGVGDLPVVALDRATENPEMERERVRPAGTNLGGHSR